MVSDMQKEDVHIEGPSCWCEPEIFKTCDDCGGRGCEGCDRLGLVFAEPYDVIVHVVHKSIDEVINEAGL